MMNKKDSINSILRLLEEETKKLKKKKKKKKFSPVAITPFRRSFGSIFSMDAAVSESLNEGYGQKPVTKKFDHLKWKLNEYQKHFLDDFISIQEESLKASDYEYASKQTGIPAASIKSIRNTYGSEINSASNDELKKHHQDTVGKMLDDANDTFTDVRNIPQEKNGKVFQMNPEPKFRGKSLKELEYEKEMNVLGGKLGRIHERELPGFMYEWLMYFVEGSGKMKIKESKLLNSIFLDSPIKYKYVMFSLDVPIQENKISAYDLMSNKNLSELKEFNNLVEEFNKTFGTNFIIEYQYTGNDKSLKVVLENAQNTDGQKVFNRKQIDMSFTDERRMAFFEAMKGMYGED